MHVITRVAAVITAAALASAVAAVPAEAKKPRTLRPHGAWVVLTDPISDAISEGVDDPTTIPTARDGCLVKFDRRWHATIVCPDGTVIRA
jgi:hypothetical protein